jgi:hypothetical protein
LVALLRSRGSINPDTQAPALEITASTNVNFSTSVTTSTTNPVGDFVLTGISTTQGAFSYLMSMDKTKQNYLPRVLGRANDDGNTALFVEEFYREMFKDDEAAGKIRGLKQSLVEYDNFFSDYLQEYSPAVTPYVVSELRGTKVLRLFRFWTISDGNAANEQFKISIRNIKLDTKEFDVIVRSFMILMLNQQSWKAFSRCTL